MNADIAPWFDSLRARQLPFLDELKGVAILLIVLYHSQLALGWSNWSQGQIGVDIFLVLSGWMIGRSLKPETTFSDFFKRRVWRVVPAYWTALGALSVVKLLTSHAPFDWSDFIAHIFGLQIFGPADWFFGINPSFWFISLLLLTYPLAYVLRGERSPWTILSAGMALGLFAYVVGHFSHREDVVLHVPARLISFCGGLAIAAALREQVDLQKNGVTFFVLFVISGYLELNEVTLWRPLFYALALIAVCLLATGGVVRRRSLRGWSTPMSFLGVISYEVFLLHQPLLRLGMNLPSINHLANARVISAVIGIVFSIIAGWMLNRALSVLFSRSGKLPVKLSSATPS